nr:MAG TPA: hypothetical protein [Caudoviricetes sp.]
MARVIIQKRQEKSCLFFVKKCKKLLTYASI